jgi:chromosome partitioning protein
LALRCGGIEAGKHQNASMLKAVIAFSNHKGGTAKTTSCASVAASLLELGHGPVLVVDCDPTGALSAGFNAIPPDGAKTIYHALLERGTTLKDVIRTVRPGLDLAPANRDLAAAEIILPHEPGGDVILRKALREVEGSYAFVLLDCPPNLGKLTINALSAADGVVIPLSPAYLSLNPMGQLVDTIEHVTERLNPKLKIYGVLLTRFDRRLLHAKEVEEHLRGRFPDMVFKQVIAPSVRFEEAPAGGVTILEYQPGHPGAIAYREVTKELLEHVHETNQAALSQ